MQAEVFANRDIVMRELELASNILAVHIRSRKSLDETLQAKNRVDFVIDVILDGRLWENTWGR